MKEPELKKSYSRLSVELIHTKHFPVSELTKYLNESSHECREREVTRELIVRAFDAACVKSLSATGPASSIYCGHKAAIGRRRRARGLRHHSEKPAGFFSSP